MTPEAEDTDIEGERPAAVRECGVAEVRGHIRARIQRRRARVADIPSIDENLHARQLGSVLPVGRPANRSYYVARMYNRRSRSVGHIVDPSNRRPVRVGDR